ncbi:unnamed protein product [Heligmosomoides polygyrus]|uniref:PALP domain-containing protein n=1 Tax=Heligmosomoides polygyrus TaxID=6339 RepID=A0A183G0M7_HELPZ|nr:unnamed protein product [Heligmosomoides polygyrus]
MRPHGAWRRKKSATHSTDAYWSLVCPLWLYRQTDHGAVDEGCALFQLFALLQNPAPDSPKRRKQFDEQPSLDTAADSPGRGKQFPREQLGPHPPVGVIQAAGVETSFVTQESAAGFCALQAAKRNGWKMRKRCNKITSA